MSDWLALTAELALLALAVLLITTALALRHTHRRDHTEPRHNPDDQE